MAPIVAKPKTTQEECLRKHSAGLNSKGKCSFCSNRKVLCGFNDFGCLKSELLAEWADEADPHSFVYGSNTKVAWMCSAGHTWKASPKVRYEGSGCKLCSTSRWVASRSSRILLKDHSPELASELVDKELLSGLTFSSHQVVAWLCPKGHTYELSPNHRQGGRGCPYCGDRKTVPGINDVRSLLRLGYELQDEAQGSMPRWSRAKVGFKHQVDGVTHQWFQVVGGQETRLTCFVCSNYEIQVGVNDLATTHPEIAAQWDPSNTVKPTEVTFGSNERVKFLCPKGHPWEAKVKWATGADARAYCRDCTESAGFRSKGEDEVLEVLKQLRPELKMETNVRRFKRFGLYELDIFIPELMIAVDFNGIYWHLEKFKGFGYHKSKREAAEAQGITLLEVWEDDWKSQREAVVHELEAILAGESPGLLLRGRSDYS